MIKVINDGGRPWVVRLVFSGMAYGLDFKLTYAEDKPMVEFYDARHEHTPYGQFVSRYYAETLLASHESGRTAGGLCLQGGVREWNVSGEALGRAMDWAKKAITVRNAEPPIDRQWLSQYIGDIQAAWAEGNMTRADQPFHAAEFNDSISYRPCPHHPT